MGEGGGCHFIKVLFPIILTREGVSSVCFSDLETHPAPASNHLEALARKSDDQSNCREAAAMTGAY